MGRIFVFGNKKSLKPIEEILEREFDFRLSFSFSDLRCFSFSKALETKAGKDVFLFYPKFLEEASPPVFLPKNSLALCFSEDKNALSFLKSQNTLAVTFGFSQKDSFSFSSYESPSLCPNRKIDNAYEEELFPFDLPIKALFLSPLDRLMLSSLLFVALTKEFLEKNFLKDGL